MKDIRFRAWHPDENKMYYFKNFQEIIDWQNGDPYRLDNYEYANVKYMQYTGLKDKNGKEIYEGDIVKVKLYKGEEEKYFIGKVEYFGSNFIVDADNNSEYHVYDLDGFGIDYRYNLEDCEVIGNIYDNPELLEKGE